MNFSVFFGSSRFAGILSGIFLSAALFSQIPTTSQPGGQTSANIEYQGLIVDGQASSRLVSIKEDLLKSSTAANSGYQIIVQGNTESFTVRVDAIDYSGSPARIKGLDTGKYVLTISQDGYQSLYLRLKIEDGMQYLVRVELAPRQGALIISADQTIGTLEIDGNPVLPQLLIHLNAGQHRLRARSFGWQDYDQSVNINEQMLATVDLHFAPANFAISQASNSRNRFRPGNPGTLGTSTLSFEASNRGNGVLTIKDFNGAVIRSHQFGQFDTWHQSFTWDGKNEVGESMPEGDYPWEIKVNPADDVIGDAASLSATVSIDNSSFIKFRNTMAGPAGLSLASDAYTLGESSLQLASRFGWLPSNQASGATDSLLFSFAARFGLVKNLEMSVNSLVSVFMDNSTSSSSLIGGNLSLALLPMGGEPTTVALALNLGGAVPLMTTTKYPYRAWSSGILPGGRLGAAGQFRLGLFSFLLEPVLYFAPWAPVILQAPDSLNPDNLPVASPTFFGSLNAGIYFDNDSLMVGLSTSIRTDSAFVPELPVPVSAIIQIMPLAGFVLGFDLTINLDATTNMVPACGMSLGFIQ